MSAWRRWFRSEQGKDELDAEIAAHLALSAAEKRERGADGETARKQAQHEFGNVALVKDVTRQAWGWTWLERLQQDLKYALRQLRKSPGFAITAILTLALGIGANIAIFQLIYAVMLRSLPVPHPEQLVQFSTQFGKEEASDFLHFSLYKGMSGQPALAGLCGWYNGEVTAHVGEEPVRLESPQVTGDCFATLGVVPFLGRLLTPADDVPEAGPQGYAAVLSYAYWNARYRRDPGVIGQKVVVNNLFDQPKPLVIVGVLPPDFHGLDVGREPDLYLPSYFMGAENRDETSGGWSTGMRMIGRLRPGQSMARAQAELQPVFAAWARGTKFLNNQTPTGKENAKDAKMMLKRNPVGFSGLANQFGKQLKLLQIMVAIILVAGCAYLSTLLSARAVVRRREFAVRAALGASRRRLLAQSLIESSVLVVAGTALGVLLAWSAARFLVNFISVRGRPTVLDIRPGAWVLLFGAGAALVAILLMGVLPAWRASRTNVIADIKETKIGLLSARKGKLGAFLVPVQVALSLLVVIVSALSSASLLRMLMQNNGYRLSGTVFVSTDIPMVMVKKDKAGKEIDDGKLKTTLAMYDGLLERLNHTPGIRSASLNMLHPLGGMMFMEDLSSKYQSKDESGQTPWLNRIAPHYFATMGTRVLAGRDFRREDNASSQRVCILSKSAAQYYFPNMPPLGQVLISKGENNTHTDMTVVGVVEDTRFSGLDEDAAKMVYLPVAQMTGVLNSMEVVLRTDDIESSVAVLRDQLHTLAGAHVAKVTPIQETVKESTSSTRLLSLLSSSLAGLALLLSAVGIFGLLNYSVSQRTTEIGVRMALGASRRHIFIVLLRQAVLLVVPGVVLGTVAAMLTTRFMASMLYETKPLDPLALGGSIAALLVVSAVASYLPARRAARVEPMEALRSE